MWKGSAESGRIKDVADVDGECGLSSSTNLKSMKAESEKEENAEMARNDRRQSQRQSRSVSGIGQTRRQVQLLCAANSETSSKRNGFSPFIRNPLVTGPSISISPD